MNAARFQRNAADAAAGKAAVSKRQPGEVALRQREVFKQDEFNVGFLFGGSEKTAPRDRRKGSIVVVACCVSYQHGV